MHPDLEPLLENGPVLVDGAWGTQLQARGLAMGDSPERWNLTHPDQVADVAKAYVDAGADIILTNTFGGTRFILKRHALDGQMAEINRRGIQISKEAAAGRARVFASVGPTGEMLMMGRVSADDLREAFTEQAEAIAENAPDGIVVETMTDVAEAEIAVAAFKPTGLPIVATMVFDSGAAKDRTMMGTAPEEAIQRLVAAGADAVGANCGRGIEEFVPICQRMRAATDYPLWMKANAGLPTIVDGQTVWAQTPEVFAEKALDLVDAGANFVGGCCGTSPDYIGAVHEKMRCTKE